MKKIIIAALVALSLAGCASLTDKISNVQTAINLVYASYTNPVTPARLDEAETAFKLVVVGLQGYKNLCVKHAVDTNCRANVAAIQNYTRQIPPLLTKIRNFVDTNDQINAIANFNDLVDLFNSAKSAAANAGVNVGG